MHHDLRRALLSLSVLFILRYEVRTIIARFWTKMNVSIATYTNAESELVANQLLDRKNKNRNGDCYVLDVHKTVEKKTAARIPQFENEAATQQESHNYARF